MGTAGGPVYAGVCETQRTHEHLGRKNQRAQYQQLLRVSRKGVNLPDRTCFQATLKLFVRLPFPFRSSKKQIFGSTPIFFIECRKRAFSNSASLETFDTLRDLR